MQTDDIIIFLQVVESGSVSRAARLSGKSKGAVSHAIGRLEQYLGGKLFDRISNSLQLNEAGGAFLDYARRIRDAETAARSDVRNAARQKQRRLRLATSGEFASNIISLIFIDVAGEAEDELTAMVYPRSVLSEVREQFDAILYLGTPPQPEFSDMQRKKLGAMTYSFAASPQYLESCGDLAEPRDLLDHRLIVHGSEKPVEKWVVRCGDDTEVVQPNDAFFSNDPWVAKIAAIHGQGVCLLPDFFTQQEREAGMLHEVLPQWHSDPMEVCILFWANRDPNPSLRRMLDKIGKSFNRLDEYPYAGRPLPDSGAKG